MKSLSQTVLISALTLALLLAAGVADAQETNDEQEKALQEQVQQLQKQVKILQTRLNSTSNVNARVRAQNQVSDSALRARKLRLDRQLEVGDNGSDVERLQKLLSTDSDIYPERLKTGYYGRLTAAAVRRFQARLTRAGDSDVETDGVVDGKTLRRINELLEEGAGNSGVIPPGLLKRFEAKLRLSETVSDRDGENGEKDKSDIRSRIRFNIDNSSLPEGVRVRLKSIIKGVNDSIGDDSSRDNNEEDELEKRDDDGENNDKDDGEKRNSPERRQLYNGNRSS